MFANDLVEWIMTIAHHASQECPVYNVGSDRAILIGDLARLVANEFGVDACIPEITDFDVDGYIFSIEKAKHELRLTLRHDLLSAIRFAVQNIQT
jgi:nucleoside-diphosphate-sugar epimerase